MYVYILKSLTQQTPPQYYIGITSNLKQRLQDHNQGRSKYTSQYRPWTFKNFFWFDDRAKAFEFERYLKTGSGRAFSKKHF